MLNMPPHVRTAIEALRATGDELERDLCSQALAGNHTAWLLCVRLLLDREAARRVA